MFSNQPRPKTSCQDSLVMHLEELEQRQMLAGNVEVFLDGSGALFITGDDASNRVELVSDGTTITVTGQGTDLNGGDEPLEFSRSSVFDINIELFDGSDRVTMIAQNDSSSFRTGFGGLFCGPNIDPNGTLFIDTGDGNDRVTLIAENDTSAGFFIDMDIDTGEGNDRILFEANNSGMFGFEARDVSIDSGTGNDRLEFEANNFNFSTGFDFQAFDLTTGSDNDRVNFTANNAANTTGYRFGLSGEPDSMASEDRETRNETGPSANGFFDAWTIETGDGSDRIEIEASNGNNSTGYELGFVNFDTGSGKDRLTIEAENTGNSKGIDASSGNFTTGMDDDRISILAENSTVDINDSGIVFTQSLTIDTGGGRDRLDVVAQNSGSGVGIQVGPGPTAQNSTILAGSSPGEFTVMTGDEDDRINVTAKNRGGDFAVGTAGIAAQSVRLFAGQGNDRLQVRGENRDDQTAGIVVLESVRVFMEGGDDQVSLSAREFLSLAFAEDDTLFDGGTGNGDRLRVNFGALDEDLHVNFEDAPEDS